MQRTSPFRYIGIVFLGLSISLIYSLLSSTLLYFSAGKSAAQLFLTAYNTSVNTPISLGLIIGTALVVFHSQAVFPATIEAAFSYSQLAKTDYCLYKQRFLSGKRSVLCVAEFFMVSLIIFSDGQFPLQGLAEFLVIIPACLQYALLVYASRKIFYAGMMLHSLLDVVVDRDLFKEHELDDAKVWTHMTSALAIVSIFIHIIGYNEGTFLLSSLVGESVKPFLMLPPLLAATMLVILIFHARFVLGKLYDRSIAIEENKSGSVSRRALGGELFPGAQEGSIRTAPRRFRIAFSFAGEQRDYVAQVATMLAARFGEAAILYDKFHEAEFARRDLAFYLPDLYQKESDLVIMVLCQDYKVKEWCGLEWDAIFDLLKRRKNEDVMLCRFGQALVRGLYSTAGFLELDGITVHQTTTRILERLALNEGKPKGYYLSGSSVEAQA